MEINLSYEDFLDDIKAVRGEVGVDELEQLYDNGYESQINPLEDLPTETGVKPITEGGVGEGGTRTVNGFDTTVNAGKQGKHIIGNNNYIEGRSFFNGTVGDAQRLVDEFAGTGEWISTNKERVNRTVCKSSNK